MWSQAYSYDMVQTKIPILCQICLNSEPRPCLAGKLSAMPFMPELLSKATENTGLPNGVTAAHMGHPCGAGI